MIQVNPHPLDYPYPTVSSRPSRLGIEETIHDHALLHSGVSLSRLRLSHNGSTSHPHLRLITFPTHIKPSTTYGLLAEYAVNVNVASINSGVLALGHFAIPDRRQGFISHALASSNVRTALSQYPLHASPIDVAIRNLLEGYMG